ncbi:ATP-binding protein [Rhizobium sp. ZW T2_16]|jgi:two-component system osmolarity sensor histidine kinase EnvZ|uniref:ATP-binding protein n=1 Tax=Rhizobium sp. ZW T2_16 TaxID=3378083 RepID=UPI000F9FFA7C
MLLRKIGIVARIALIVTAALFVSQLVVVISYLHGERSPPPPFAIAKRIAAVVRLLDETETRNREDVLAVSSVSGFQVSVISAMPEGFEDDFSLGRMGVLTQKMIDDLEPGRIVRVGAVKSGEHRRNSSLMIFVVGLNSGEMAQFSVSDETTLRVWNLPVGFLAGFFGIVVAIIAVLAVARETRPLAQLARTVDELGNRIEPVQVKERGARELRTLIRAINAMQGRILGLVNNRTLFLGAISHDLKTYLTRFRLRLEMMPAGTHREKAIHDVETMEQLLNDVLLFASESSAGSEAETVELNAAISASAAEVASAGDVVHLALSANPLKVRLPRKALLRVIDNLLSNALRYGTHARIRTERRDGMACLIVEDDGPGIEEKDMPFVFEPFFRAEPSRNRSHGGTGLGLAIVRQILDAHGGAITLENKTTGSGLVATVCLPAEGLER